MRMSGVTNQEEDKKPTDQAHINLKVKGQVSLSLFYSILYVCDDIMIIDASILSVL